MRKEINDDLCDLLTDISNLKEVQQFKKLEAEINDNSKIMSLVDEIKNLQKQVVHLRHYKKIKALRQTEKMLAKKQAQLDEMPIMQDYQESLHQVNALLEAITDVMSKKIQDGSHTCDESR